MKKKPDSNAGLIVKTRMPDEKPEEQDDPAMAIEACAQALIRAVHAHDSKAASQAIKDAFDILESSPHDEGAEPHSYDAQNEAASEDNE